MNRAIRKNNFSIGNSDKKDVVEEWYSGEGQLLCDVYEKGDYIIVKSTIAGVDPKDIDISVAHDVLTVRGSREMEEEVEDNDFYARECYWGSFSRSIVLPHEIDQKNVSASLKNGVLTIKLPKKYKSTSIKIRQSNG
jgi:HSP20 family protein